MIEPSAPSTSGVWSLATVEYVAGLRSSQPVSKVDLGSGKSPDEMMRVVSEWAWKELVLAAQVRAVDLDERDCVISRREHDEDAVLGWGVILTARWWPQTNSARLVGGQRDGEVCAIRGLDQGERTPLRLVERTAAPAWTKRHDSASSAPRSVEYRLGGWNANDRVWLYLLEGLPPL